MTVNKLHTCLSLAFASKQQRTPYTSPCLQTARMYHREKSIQIKNSASALYNNLSVLRIAPRRLTYFAVVHANVVNVVSASWDGLSYSHRQLQSKEPNVATSTSLIMQVNARRFFRVLLTSRKPTRRENGGQNVSASPGRQDAGPSCSMNVYTLHCKVLFV